MTERLDTELVRRGLARSRSVARELIGSGAVLLDGSVAHKPATPVDETVALEVTRTETWVGRAAYKLSRALEVFPLEPAGKRCIDLGASTGGFTQVLLSRGATRVEAIDVGHGQLAAPVREHDAVNDRSGLNVRDVVVADIGGPAPLVVGDLSFISLRLVVSVLRSLVTDDGDVMMLVKPQFEVGRERLARTGVVSAPSERARAVRDVCTSFEGAGLSVWGLAPSPIEGGTGNREYLLWARPDAAGRMGSDKTDSFIDTIAEGTA